MANRIARSPLAKQYRCVAMCGASEFFGRDLGLIHEVVVTGRKVGLGRDEWAKLAHDRCLARKVVELILAEPTVEFKKLLELLSTVSVDAVTSFVVAEMFKIDTTGDVRIAHIRSNFQRDFIGKVEDSCGAVELKIHRLRVAAADKTYGREYGIIPALGGRAETMLAQVYALIAKQGKGQEGCLLVNGERNLAYVRDKNEVLRAVNFYWSKDSTSTGWIVGSTSTEDKSRWLPDDRIVSH